MLIHGVQTIDKKTISFSPDLKNARCHLIKHSLDYPNYLDYQPYSNSPCPPPIFPAQKRKDLRNEYQKYGDALVKSTQDYIKEQERWNNISGGIPPNAPAPPKILTNFFLGKTNRNTETQTSVNTNNKQTMISPTEPPPSYINPIYNQSYDVKIRATTSPNEDIKKIRDRKPDFYDTQSEASSSSGRYVPPFRLPPFQNRMQSPPPIKKQYNAELSELATQKYLDSFKKGETPSSNQPTMLDKVKPTNSPREPTQSQKKQNKKKPF